MRPISMPFTAVPLVLGLLSVAGPSRAGESAPARIRPVFTTSRRQSFNNPCRHFIGTAESARGGPDDDQMGVIESPAFVLKRGRHIALVSGGTRAAKVHVALVDAKTGKKLLRWVSRRENNTLQEHVVDTAKLVGREVRVRVVDRATGGWGHVNFGGLFVVEARADR